MKVETKKKNSIPGRPIKTGNWSIRAFTNQGAGGWKEPKQVPSENNNKKRRREGEEMG